MANIVPKNVRKKIINKISKTINSSNEKNYVLLFVSREEKGISTEFISTMNEEETVGVIEQTKLNTINLFNKNKVEEVDEPEISYVQ